MVSLINNKNTLLIDNPKLDVREVNIKDSNPVKIVFWGSDPNIETSLSKHSDIFFITSFTHKSDNVISLLDEDFDINRLLKMLNIKGFAGIGLFKKKPAYKRPVFLKNNFFIN